MLKKIVLIALTMLPNLSYSSSNLTAHVLYAGVYGDGRFFVGLDVTIDEPNCAQSRIDVAPGHPQIDRWLSVALAAHLSGKPIRIKTNGCYGGYPTLDQTQNSWLHSND